MYLKFFKFYLTLIVWWFKSYLENRHFITKVGSEFSHLSPILAGVTQGAILSPILYNIYAVDQPTCTHTSVAEFADDKIIFTSHKDPYTAGIFLQNHLDNLDLWYSKWKIKVNNEKFSHITFTLKKGSVPKSHFPTKLYHQLPMSVI